MDRDGRLRHSRPPRIAEWLAGLRMSGDAREFQLGDLHEEFDERTRTAGRRAAVRWYRRQAIRCVVYRSKRVGTASRRGDGRSATNWRRLGFGALLDLRYGFRLIRRAPVVSAAAILTLALGIGANVAIFTVAWPVLAAPLPLPDEGRLALVMLAVEREEGPPRPNPISPSDYFALRRAQSFQTIAGFNNALAERNLTGHGDPIQLMIGSVTEDFFEVLGVGPILGRSLDARDSDAGIPSLVLHERSWRRHFGARTTIIGETARLDGQAWQIVGVMPDAATIGTLDADGWALQPLDESTARQQRSYFLSMVGRLEPKTTLDVANVELSTLMRAVAEEYPETNEGISARAESFRERLTGPVRPVFLLLLGGAGLVLVVAGINLAGLQVSRNLARTQELAVRWALGAERARIVRQLTAESLVLSALGGVAGLAAAAMTLRALASIAPAVAWYDISTRLTLPVALYTCAITVAVGLAIGLGPALVSVARSGVAPSASRGGTASRVVSRRRTLVISTQVAVTVVLLIAATLTGTSLVRVLQVDPGFELARGLIADVRAPGSTSERIGFFDELVSHTEALPGVERSCAINHVPLDNAGGWMTYVAEGSTDEDRVAALPLGATDGCFEVLRVPLVAGRLFERVETESVAIVSASMAESLWPGEVEVAGRRIHIGLTSGPLFTVVGVARDIHSDTLESRAMGQVWTSASRGWPTPQRVIMRTDVPPETLAGPLREVLKGLDPGLALANVRTMQDIVGAATASRRFVLVLLGGFAVIALTLCAVGIYGVLSNHVGQRTREIGIRLALGAPSNGVLRLVLQQVASGVLVGLIAGAAGAWVLSSIMSTQLFEISATDERVYVGVAVFVGLVTFGRGLAAGQARLSHQPP